MPATPRSRTIARAMGGGSAAAAVFAALWVNFSDEKKNDGIDVEALRRAQPAQTLCFEFDALDAGAGTDLRRHTCAPGLKRVELAAGQWQGKPVRRYCGTLKERDQRCPGIWSDNSVAACCCAPGQFVHDDCRCGTDAGLVDDAHTVNDEGAAELCRLGRVPDPSADGGSRACNPRRAGCVPWPVRIILGEQPGQVARQASVDAGT